MGPGIEISVTWFDDDVVGLLVCASNGRFEGLADAYASPGVAKDMASAFRGFPVRSSDQRSFEVGTFDPNLAGGGVRFRLRCLDDAGHAVVELELRSDPQLRGPEMASFRIPFVAGDLDSLVSQLERMPLKVGSKVNLNAV